MTEHVCGRSAPSPSGYMHLGNAFSTLLAWLSARSRGGQFVLRLEDLDKRCEKEEYRETLLADLRWLGLDWDGEITTQTLRVGAYAEVLEAISQVAELYPCFCTRADLHAASAPHASDGTPVYTGTCHGMSADEVELRSKNRNPALRIHVPNRVVSFVDGHMGPHTQNLQSECGDFVLRRSDGVFAYQLACVVDDIYSGVTQVVRAHDLLSSTPRQIYLYELLGAKPPQFYHHPLLIAPDGRRLSKRDADLEIARLRAQGARPEEIIGRLAYMAGIIDEIEPVMPSELAEAFDWSKVPTQDIVAI